MTYQTYNTNGREPELQNYDDGKAPMLGGARRLWPSISAYLMKRQHQAHRAGDMSTVWALRRMREGIRQHAVALQYESVRTGSQYDGMTDQLALDAIQRELKVAREQLAMYEYGKRTLRVQELKRTIAVIMEVIEFWEARIDSPC